MAQNSGTVALKHDRRIGIIIRAGRNAVAIRSNGKFGLGRPARRGPCAAAARPGTEQNQPTSASLAQLVKIAGLRANLLKRTILCPNRQINSSRGQVGLPMENAFPNALNYPLEIHYRVKNFLLLVVFFCPATIARGSVYHVQTETITIKLQIRISTAKGLKSKLKTRF